MKITFCCTDTKAEPWLQGLAVALPGAEISVWQPGAPQADYAVVWAPPQQSMDEQRGLQALSTIGAGVDGFLRRRLPPGPPAPSLAPSSRATPRNAQAAKTTGPRNA